MINFLRRLFNRTPEPTYPRISRLVIHPILCRSCRRAFVDGDEVISFEKGGDLTHLSCYKKVPS